MAYVWVDALRYEMAYELAQALSLDADSEIEAALATVPTITLLVWLLYFQEPSNPRALCL